MMGPVEQEESLSERDAITIAGQRCDVGGVHQASLWLSFMHGGVLGIDSIRYL